MIGYNEILEDEFIKEAVGDYKLVPSKFGFVHSRADDFTDDGNFFTCYRYKGDGNRLSIWTQGTQGGRSTRASENEEFISLDTYGDRDYITDEEYRAADNYNGVPGFANQAEADAALQELANIAEKIYRAKHEDQYKDRKEADEGKYVVEIVQGSGKLRAVADDGEHGKAFVMFPNALRNRVGQRYQVDGLRWNGKNYSVIGKPQILESEQECSKRKIREDESFVDYAVDLIEDYCYMEKDLETTTRQEIIDFIYNDICDDDLSDYKPSKEDIDAIIDRLIKSGYKVTEDEIVDEVQEIAEPLIGELILKAIPSYISDKIGWRLDWGNPTPEDFYVHISVPNNDEDELKDIAFYSKDYKFDGYKTEVNQFDDNVEIHFIKEDK